MFVEYFLFSSKCNIVTLWNESFRFYYFRFRLFIYIYRSPLYTKAYPEGHHLRGHIKYSGLEGTKGDTSAIRRYFADEEPGCDVVEEEEEGDEEAVGICFVSFVSFSVLWSYLNRHIYCSGKQTSKDHELSSKKQKHDESKRIRDVNISVSFPKWRWGERL